jgi:branched-chain amino acid transport system substrate-binding protein
MIGGSAPILTHERNPWVFRTKPNDIYSARALAAFTVTTLHLTKIAIIHNNDIAGSEEDALLRADLKALAVTPVTDQSFVANTTDLTAQVLAIRKSGATALIGYVGVSADDVTLGRQMNRVGLHLTWLGSASLSAVAARKPGGALLYGTYAATDYAAGQSPEAAAFDRASQATLNLPGDFASGYAYDGLQILALVMHRVGTNPQAIRHSILAIRGYRGVMGTYNFDRNGDGLHQYTIVQNVQGRLRVVKVLIF